MKYIKEIFKAIGVLSISIVVGTIILYGGNIFVQKYGDASIDLTLNDIIIFCIYTVQLVVSAILSWLVYRLSKKESERDEQNTIKYKKNSIKYIINEINYNKNILFVLKMKGINEINIHKNFFKTVAWEEYNIFLIEILKIEDYNKILSYYAGINLLEVGNFKKEVLEKIDDVEQLFNILNNISL